MEYLIFKNPKIKYRKEAFGGLLRFDLNIFILNKREYNFLNKIKRYIRYSNLSKPDMKIADKFLKNNIVLKLKLSKANKIIERLQK
jgi:hypothetical protein